MKCSGTPDDDTTFDGLLDIKNSASFITVSYNFIHDHAKVGLIGSSDTDSAERRVTYAHNRYDTPREQQLAAPVARQTTTVQYWC